MKNLRKLFFCTSLCVVLSYGLFIPNANSQASIPLATEIGDGEGKGGYGVAISCSTGSISCTGRICRMTQSSITCDGMTITIDC